MEDTDIAEGVYGYDIGQVPAQPVLITDPDKGKVGDLKPALRELVLDSPGNRAVRVSDESRAIGIQYIELDGDGGKEYTMPAERIATPPAEITMDDGSLLAHEYNMYLVLRAMFAEAAREDEAYLLELVELAKTAGLPTDAVSKAHEAVEDTL